MNEFLANLYGTAEDIGATAGDDTEKLAQAQIMNEMFEAEGIDVDQLAPETIVKVAESLFGDDNEITPEDVAAEPEAGDEDEQKLAEADFLGRVMAHSYVNEMGEIEKQAASVRGAGKAIGRGAHWLGAKLTPSSLAERVGARASKGVGRARAAQTAAAGLKGKAKARAAKAIASERRQASGRAMTRLRKGVGYGAAGLGVAGTGAAGYGGYKALKKQSAMDTLAEQRAMEILAESGYDIDNGETKLANAVEQRAYEMLAAEGFEIE